MNKLPKISLLLFAFIVLTISGCKKWDNFTTYFNTYYNADRLMSEAREEFAFQEEKKRITPHVYVPEPKIALWQAQESGVPDFMKEFLIPQQTLQPVKIKLDSIIIKGSKILSKHPKSEFIEKTLLLMAQSFFYQSQWLNSQNKCGELIDRFPEGDLSPDAHLLLAENYLIQRKFIAGKTLLSRTIDIAWYKKRYDILSEAFRLQADLALYGNDEQGALKPYLQAIAQSDDDELRAKWQISLAALFFRMNKFDKAERAFAKVRDYSPDYLGEFESKLYQASCMSRQGKFKDADKMLSKLEDDGNFKEWSAFIYAERMQFYRLMHDDTTFKKAEKIADSAYGACEAIPCVYFEKAMDYYYADNYTEARNYFARAKLKRSPYLKFSQKMYTLMNGWESRRSSALPLLTRIDNCEDLAEPDSANLALYAFELGRIHDQLGNLDSAHYYYQISASVAPVQRQSSAKYFYVLARYVEKDDPETADSLLDIVALNYPKTDYGKDAIHKLGYTEEFVIDTVGELYKSGVNLRKNREYNYAIRQFLKIPTDFPKNPLAPKGLYATGWIFEKDMKQMDSAFAYYYLLINKYPLSEYAKDLTQLTEYYLAKTSGQPIPDSLKDQSLIKFVPNPMANSEDPTKKAKGTGSKKIGKQKSSALDVINKPDELLKEAAGSFSNPDDMINKQKEQFSKENIKNSLIPGVEFKNPFEDLLNQDSTDNKAKEKIEPKK